MAISCCISILTGFRGRGRGLGRGRGRNYPSGSFPHARSNLGTTGETRNQLHLEITHEEYDNLHRKLPAFPGTGRK
jgi:hypothetical protein